eukprot:4790583-Lingulodinium_polyedra.AAC.2
MSFCKTETVLPAATRAAASPRRSTVCRGSRSGPLACGALAGAAAELRPRGARAAIARGARAVEERPSCGWGAVALCLPASDRRLRGDLVAHGV